MKISPLSNSNDVTLLKIIQSEQLIHDWKQTFQIDIREELHGNKEIYLYECNKTKLKFFMPVDIAGSYYLYHQLEKFEWYYITRKWEHDVAVEDLKNYQRILEVGCGRGDFVNRLRQEFQLDAQGIELNKNAVSYAISEGIPVSEQNLYDLTSEKPDYFDAVCCFQVLEHIPNPRKFLLSLIKIVKPNGKLIISVPNSESFPKYSPNNLLDQPPHHMTQWCKETFNNISVIFPVRVKKFRIEPLAKYHIDWYVSIQLSRFFKELKFQRHNIHQLLKYILNKFSFLRYLIKGHTLYVCFEKIA